MPLLMKLTDPNRYRRSKAAAGLPAGDVEIVCRGLLSQHAAVARNRRRGWKASGLIRGSLTFLEDRRLFGVRHFEDELNCVRSAPDIRAWLEW
jgi:hypothetical protein